MQLFYNSDIDKNTKEITFDKIESRHIIRVLRKKTGNKLNVTNGKGLLFTTEIIIENDKKCVVKVLEIIEKIKPWNYFLHIAIAPTKLNDRFEWFLEKATEIGIDEITPIICDNSERKVIKMERYQKIILSAMKQSLKFNLPKLNPLTSFNDFIDKNIEHTFIAHCEDTQKKTLKNVIKPAEKTTILIGPEGDFSTKEIEKALSKKISPISLGESRLRTETAGLVAVQNVAFINQ